MIPFCLSICQSLLGAWVTASQGSMKILHYAKFQSRIQYYLFPVLHNCWYVFTPTLTQFSQSRPRLISNVLHKLLRWLAIQELELVILQKFKIFFRLSILKIVFSCNCEHLNCMPKSLFLYKYKYSYRY